MLGVGWKREMWFTLQCFCKLKRNPWLIVMLCFLSPVFFILKKLKLNSFSWLHFLKRYLINSDLYFFFVMNTIFKKNKMWSWTQNWFVKFYLKMKTSGDSPNPNWCQVLIVCLYIRTSIDESIQVAIQHQTYWLPQSDVETFVQGPELGYFFSWTTIAVNV